MIVKIVVLKCQKCDECLDDNVHKYHHINLTGRTAVLFFTKKTFLIDYLLEHN